jgi:YbbR domain-containing protein
MLRQDLFYKLVAVVTALALWAYVQEERNPRIAVNVPSVQLDLRNLAKGNVVTSGTGEVSITIEGNKNLIDAVDRKKLTAWVDLAGRTAGTHSLPVQVALPRNAPSDVTASAVPGSVTMTVESVSNRVMNIDVNYTSAPPWGYDLGTPKLTPASAYVSGRSASVERVRRLAVMIDPSSLGSPRTSLDGYFSVVALDASGNEVKDVTVDPSRTRVRLAMVRTPATKIVIVSPSFSGQPRFGYVVKRVTAKPGEVTIKGRPELLYNISTITTEEIDIDGAAASITKDAALRAPPGVEVDLVKTVRVTVRIEEREEPQ